VSGRWEAITDQPSPRLAVRRLTLTDFRNYSHLRLETDCRPVVLAGPNGAGKTNLLEALSLLAPGRGMRRAALADLARGRPPGGGAWAVAARFDGPNGRIEIGTGCEGSGDRRVVRLDGKPAKPAALAGVISALWLTPAMDRLFIEGAAGRRRFLDRLVLGLESDHGREASAYDHAMRERTRLLTAEGPLDRTWAGALEDAMARHGVAMAAARRRAVALLDESCRRQSDPFPAARLAVTGEVEGWLAEMDPAAAEERFRTLLATARPRDGAARAATIGPHRTDLAVRHAGRDMPAELCSTGEQKAVLVSIVLAQARLRTALKGTAPVLLLDEGTAHLDATRRVALYDALSDLSAQSWMTGTDLQAFAEFGDRAQYFRVTDGSVAPA
jgi:DNA replication and repair protein RecF